MSGKKGLLLKMDAKTNDVKKQGAKMSERIIHKTKPSSVKKGDMMTLLYFVKVENVQDNGEHLVVKDVDQDQGSVHVNGRTLVENSFSADRYDEVKELNQTEVLKILIISYNRPFTVVFDKDNGEERTLRGRLISHDDLRGRSTVEDLDKPAGKRIRQVDHRTVKSLIVDGVKYEVK